MRRENYISPRHGARRLYLGHLPASLEAVVRENKIFSSTLWQQYVYLLCTYLLRQITLIDAA